jgi:hypothetical protein
MTDGGRDPGNRVTLWFVLSVFAAAAAGGAAYYAATYLLRTY